MAAVRWEDVAGQRRLVATVDLSAGRGRYPAPSWWAGADAYAASALNDLAQPSAFVSIRGQRLRLAAVPRGDGSLLRVDLTEAGAAVRPGDSVCLLGDERGLKDLADVSAAALPAAHCSGPIASVSTRSIACVIVLYAAIHAGSNSMQAQHASPQGGTAG